MVVRGKGRPSTAEAVAIERAIRDAALDALIREGPGVTMNAIAEASGLSRKTVYARFANKEALFVAVIRGVLAESEPVVFDTEGGFEDQVAAYGRAALRLMRQPAAIALQRLLETNPEFSRVLGRDMAMRVDQNFVAPLRACLAVAEAAGEVQTGDRERILRAIVTLLFAESSRMFRKDSGPVPDAAALEAGAADFARFVAALVCHGVMPR